MIVTDKNITTITCDKCKTAQSEDSEVSNDKFFMSGWCLNKGRKYMHLCKDCQSPTQRRAMAFARERFPPKQNHQ